MTSINWLHLTDLHLRSAKETKESLRAIIQKRFFEDLKRLQDACGPWDLLLITGDLVFSGKAEEFDAASEFLDVVLKQLGSVPKVLVVPGNHDLARPDRSRATTKLLLEWNAHEDVQKQFWSGDSQYRDIVKDAFASYEKWWSNWQPKPINTGMLPGDFSYTFEKDGAQLGIVGLNSAFLHLADVQQRGLAMSAAQFNEACGGNGVSWANEQHACILMTHHPPDWLNTKSETEFRQGIADPNIFAAHFYGHMHEPRMWSTRDAGGQPRRGFQGKSLFSEEPIFGNLIQRLYGYSAGRLELSDTGAELRVWPRQAVAPGDTWIFVPDFHNYQLETNPAGNYVKTDSLQLIKRYVPRAASVVPGGEEKATPKPLTLIVQRDGTVNLEVTGQPVVTGSIDYDDPVNRVVQPIIESLRNNNNDIKPRDLELLGKFLFKALFNGKVRRKFEDLLTEAKAAGRRLRIQLRFATDHELATLPWEYMFYYKDVRTLGYYLSTQADLVLSRFMQERRLNPDEVLRILLVVSDPNPADPNAFTTDQALAPFKGLEGVKAVRCDRPQETLFESPGGRVHVTVCEQPTYAHLSTHLSEHLKPFHVVHFIGQGDLAPGDSHEIAMRGPRSVDWISEDDFVQLFKDKEAVPKLVFLQVREEGKEPEKRVATLTQKLITAEVHFVVAMQHRMSNEAVETFSAEFYKRLAEGRPVDAAVQAGRHSTINAVRREFGTPVVYLCSDAALITEKEKDKEKKDEGQTLQRPSEKGLSVSTGPGQ